MPRIEVAGRYGETSGELEDGVELG